MGSGPGREEWREVFGYDEPYENQADAIEAAIEVGRERGFLVMEGPCGTGKTMAALTAGASLLRHTDQYETVVVITPVKQQLQQFVDDLRRMNEGLDEPLSGIALVGKTDLCPYAREGVFPADVGVNDRCSDLREHTAELVEGDRDRAGSSTPAGNAAVRSVRDRDEAWWDPERASDLARSAHRDTGEVRSRIEARLATAGAVSPYVARQPSAPAELAASGDPPLFCPFEADWYARDKGSPVGFDAGEARVITSREFLPAAVERGTCPHRVMGVLLEEADVVVGNYNHLFDPRTRELTGSILDEETFVIVDEAHRLEERVRDLLSETIGRQSLRQARNDLDRLLRSARQRAGARERVEARLDEHEVPLEAVERARRFYADLLAWLGDRIDAHLAEEFDGYGTTEGRSGLPEGDRELPLRDPSADEPDELTEWAAEAGYGAAFARRLGAVGAAVEDAVDDIDPDRTCVCAAVGTLFGRWWERDRTDYFREIELEYSPKEREDPAYPWERTYTPSLVMYNCMPADQLREVFAGLGGGVLMSATLEPLDVFEEVVGLAGFAGSRDRDGDGTVGGDGERDGDGTVGGDGERDADVDGDRDRVGDRESGDGGAPGEGGAVGSHSGSRPVVERTYELPFPPSNRASWIVDAPPFTLRNRGDPGSGDPNETREEYAYVLRTIARSPGNVLIAMPSYREAAWAADRLRTAVEKPVLLDEPSSNEATEELKREFFAGDGAVVATSARGTLTEGVDYDGEKLRTCAVVGIPLVSVGSPRVQAVRHAYGQAFGPENAFEYALTIPAVRRARQAIGRVIRGPEEVGARIFVDHRYTAEARRHSVYEYLPPDEREEFVRMTPMFLESQIEAFWADRLDR